MDDHQTRMLSGLTGLGGLGQGDPNDPDPVRKQQDIGDILQQIMAITDESLDEAQARYLFETFFLFLFNGNVVTFGQPRACTTSGSVISNSL